MFVLPYTPIALMHYLPPLNQALPFYESFWMLFIQTFWMSLFKILFMQTMGGNIVGKNQDCSKGIYALAGLYCTTNLLDWLSSCDWGIILCRISILAWFNVQNILIHQLTNWKSLISNNITFHLELILFWYMWRQTRTHVDSRKAHLFHPSFQLTMYLNI